MVDKLADLKVEKMVGVMVVDLVDKMVGMRD
jgi:hypothetical protein